MHFNKVPNSKIDTNFTEYFAFKGYKQFTELVEFDLKPITVFVGPNNAGKSTVYEAMSFFENRVLPSVRNYKNIISLNKTEESFFCNKVEFIHDAKLIVWELVNALDREYYRWKNSDIRFHYYYELINGSLCLQNFEIIIYIDNKKIDFASLNEDHITAFHNVRLLKWLLKGFSVELDRVEEKAKLSRLFSSKAPINFEKDNYNILFREDAELFEIDGIEGEKKASPEVVEGVFNKVFDNKGIVWGFENEGFHPDAVVARFEDSMPELNDYLAQSGLCLRGINIDSFALNKLRLMLLNKLLEKGNFDLSLDGVHLFISNESVHNVSSEMGLVLHKFQKANDEVKQRINELIQYFGIADEFTSKEIYENEYIGEYVQNGEKLNVKYLGTGAKHLLSMILAIELGEKYGISGPNGDNANVFGLDPNLSAYRNKTVYIEEPESNLHPKYQAKLADLFVKMLGNLESPSNQFIVETHSEYLIRKLQYLVAKDVQLQSNVVVYYFNEDKEAQERIYPIKINPDGSLSRPFGPGFYDEALNWKLELMKLKNKN